MLPTPHTCTTSSQVPDVAFTVFHLECNTTDIAYQAKLLTGLDCSVDASLPGEPVKSPELWIYRLLLQLQCLPWPWKNVRSKQTGRKKCQQSWSRRWKSSFSSFKKGISDLRGPDILSVFSHLEKMQSALLVTELLSQENNSYFSFVFVHKSQSKRVADETNRKSIFRIY